MQIQAAVSHPGGNLTIETGQLDAPKALEVMVKIEACGICHTDLLASRSKLGTRLPAVLGHEGVGRVQQVGEGIDHLAPGDRVVMSFGACGQCASCLNQETAYCQQALPLNFLGRRLDGSSPLTFKNLSPVTGHFFAQSSFSTHAIVRSTNVVKIDDDLPSHLIVPMACGVQTGISSIVNILQPLPHQRLAVFGCGTVGLSAIIAAKNMGCKEVMAIDVKDERLSLATELGATQTVNGTDPRAVEEVLKAAGGIHFGFDCTGSPRVIEQGFAHLLQQGKMLCAGVSHPDSHLSIDPRALVFGGRMLLGTVEGDANPHDCIPFMIDWYRKGKLPMERLVKTYAFNDIQQAMDDLSDGITIKPVLLMP